MPSNLKTLDVKKNELRAETRVLLKPKGIW